MAEGRTSIGPVAAAVGLTLVALAGIGFAAYQRAADQLLQRAEDTYTALMELRRDALQSHLQTVAGQVRYSAADRTIRGILVDFRIFPVEEMGTLAFYAIGVHDGDESTPEARQAMENIARDTGWPIQLADRHLKGLEVIEPE